MKKAFNRTICGVLAVVLLTASGVPALATTSEELKKQQKELEKQQKDLQKQQNAIESQKKESQSGLNNANQNISEIQGEQAELQEGIDAANEELVGLLTSIDLIQADIEDMHESIRNGMGWDAHIFIFVKKHKIIKMIIAYS